MVGEVGLRYAVSSARSRSNNFCSHSFRYGSAGVSGMGTKVPSGVNAPSVAGLEKFARALKVEVVDLFTFTGRKPTRTRRLAIRKGGAWPPI